MRVTTLGKSLLFGLFVALSWLPADALLSPYVGTARALAVFAGLVLSLYVSAIAPSLSQGVRLAVPFSMLAAGAFVWAPNLGTALLFMAVGLSVCRSGFLYRSRPVRAVVLELALIVGGLTLATWLGRGGSQSQVLGIWAFFLVQSMFFVVGAVHPRKVCDEERDPFDVARARALSTLEDC